MAETTPPNESPLFCDRCLSELTPGAGNFYVVKIEAVADPTPPTFQAEDLQRDVRKEIDELVAQMEDMTPQEAVDQVLRRVTIYLCRGCYDDWIENPAGENASP